MESEQKVIKEMIEEKLKQDLHEWMSDGNVKGEYKVENAQNGLIRGELYLTMDNLKWKYTWYYCQFDGTPLIYRTELFATDGNVVMSGLPESDELKEKECKHYRVVVFNFNEIKDKLEELEKKAIFSDLDSEGRLVVVFPKV